MLNVQENSRSTDWLELCVSCQVKARESFYKRVKQGNPCKHTRVPKKLHLRAPEHPPGSIHKRCPSCQTHVWVVRTQDVMICWKCQKNLKISIALRDSTCHRGGVILSVIL